MALRDELEMIGSVYKDKADQLAHNETLFNIYEGDLLSYVLADLKEQLSEKTYQQIQYRVAPINVLKRLIDKLSKIYIRSPKRELDGGSEKDAALFTWYQERMQVDVGLSLANEFFNLFKTAALEPFVYRGVPKLRVIPSDRFFVHSTDKVNPMRPTHFTKIMGEYKNEKDETHTALHTYTDTEFFAHNEEGEVLDDVMAELSNQGVNIFGRIPFVYINRSRHDLCPISDTDTLAMTKLIPVLLSDANYATMFQAFSIIYGIDLDQEGLVQAPNALWMFKSDPDSDKKPEVGVIKPELDTDKCLDLIKAQLSFWMQSRNIRPGSIGELSTENMSSGISKAIDEMDTSEDRQKQVPYFMEAEAELWELIIHHMHPVWMREPDFQNKVTFSHGLQAKVNFPEQRALVDSSKQIADEKLKIELGIQSRRGALKEIYPDWTDKQVDERLAEVELERTVNIEVPADEAEVKAEAEAEETIDV